MFWLVKTEAETYSIDDLAKDKATAWDCVRNYQARNFLREMKLGELVFIYHSNSEPSAIVGLAKVSKQAFADQTQFDSKSDYFDAKATKENPRWFSPELKFMKKFKKAISLSELKKIPGLKNMTLLKLGSRLSVQPVSENEFKTILSLL